MEVQEVVDARGRRCPWGIVEAGKRFRNLAAGTVLAIDSDDPVSATQVPAWCQLTGHEYLGEEAGAGCTRYLVRRKE